MYQLTHFILDKGPSSGWLCCCLRDCETAYTFNESCTSRHVPFWILSHVTMWLRLSKSCTGYQSLRGSSTSCASWFTSCCWVTHQSTSRTCWHRSPKYQCFVIWQPHCATDTSTYLQQSFLCCCTASMEQAADRPETPVHAIYSFIHSFILY